MNKKELVTEVVKLINEQLQGVTAIAMKVSKANGIEYTGIQFRTDGSSVASVIYLDDLLEKSKSAERIAAEAIKIFREHAEIPKFNLSLEDVNSFEACKSLIRPRLLNKRLNAKYLEKCISRDFFDLSLAYVIALQSDTDGLSSITVTKELLTTWGVTEEDVYNAAVSNQQEVFIESIVSVLCDYLSEPLPSELLSGRDELLWVVSNKERTNGAGVILQHNTLQKLTKLLGEEFYVIPSSVHETLVTSCNSKSAQMLLSMLKEVNSTCVAQADFLSNNLYKYSTREGFSVITNTMILDLN